MNTPDRRNFLSIGEVMVELSPREGGEWRMGTAGDTLNTAWYLAQLLPLPWRVDYLTRLGRDPFSDQIADFIAKAGIGTDLIQRDPVRGPGLYAISLDQGERSFTYWRDHSAAKLLAEDREALAAAMARADMIYFSGITLAILSPGHRRNFIDALAARPAHARAVMDPNIRPRLWEGAEIMAETLMDAAAHCDIALPTFADDAEVFGDKGPADTLERYLRAGCKEVVVKDGIGTMFAVDSFGRAMSTPEAVSPVDTTGAGDSFNAGYLAARVRGADLSESLAAGQALARRVVSAHGALVALD